MKKNTVLTRQLLCLSAIVAMSSFAACSSDDAGDKSICQTGASQACACTDGSQGSQTCVAGDQGWSECTCTISPSTTACNNVVCGTHGSCVVAKEGAVCVCRDGYVSTINNGAPTCKEGSSSSDTPVTPSDDVCKDITCSDHGACVATSKGAGCLCDSGYASSIDGNTPVCIAASGPVVDPTDDPCKDIDCTDKGICTSKNGVPNCVCTGNYETGLDADNNVTCVPKTNVCDGITCDGKGTCIDMSGTANCICNDTDNYQSGTDDDGNPTCVEKGTVVDGPCKDVTCSDQGSCLVAKDEAVCLCNTGYAVDPEDKTKCVENAESPCKDINCTDKGACIVADNNTPTCMCADGYLLVNDESGNPTCKEKENVDLCEGITCDDHGRCLTASDAAICICDDGYQSTLDGQKPTCKEITGEESPCKDVTCDGNGICMVSGDDKAVCMCNNGYHQDTTGETPTCIENEEVDSPCKDVTCDGNGSCLVTASNEPFCVCATGYHQDTTGEKPTCVKDAVVEDGCKDVTCSDHGSCVVISGNKPFCVCASGYHQGSSNTSCEEDVVATNPCTDQTCSNHGTCLITGDNKAYCLCDKGYTNDSSTTCKAETVADSACKGVTCSNHGTCLVAGDNTAYCACDNGFVNDTKTTCKAVAVTDSACKGVTCSSHGTCLVAGDNTAYCACDDGYVNKGKTTCEAVAASTSPCKDITCSNHGSCVVTGDNKALCICSDGYENDSNTTCKAVAAPASPCKDVTCSDHGTCVVTGNNTAYCLCSAGYKQDGVTKCIEDTAASNPCSTVTCSGHGTCLVTGSNTAYCACDYNYKNDGPDKCVPSEGASHGHAYPTETIDPWGLTWDSQERTAATHMNAVDACEAIGGRLPTPTEVYRNNHSSGEKGVGTSSNTTAIWTDTTSSASNGVETIKLSDGSMTSTARTSTAPYRCVWPKDRPAFLQSENCHSSSADLKAGKSCKNIAVGQIKYTVDSAARPAQYWYQAAEECRKMGGRLPNHIELQQLLGNEFGNNFGNMPYLWTEPGYANSTYGWGIVQKASDALTINYSVWTTARNYICIAEQVKAEAGNAVFPQTKANDMSKVIVVDPQLRIDKTARTAASVWNALNDCMKDGGRLASLDEMVAAIRTGKLAVPTTNIATSSSYNNNAYAIAKWATFEAPYYTPSHTNSSYTTALPYYCTYRPARNFDYTSIEGRVALDDAIKYTVDSGKVSYYVYQKDTLASGAVIDVSNKAAEKMGTYLPTVGDLTFAIRQGLKSVNGTGDTLITSSPYSFASKAYNVRTLKWTGALDNTGVPTAGNVAYGTTTSSSRSFLATTVR